MARNQRTGAAGEDLAAAYLTGQGYRIIGRNLRTRFGEIDLLAEEGDTLVFVEVKARRSRRYGPPALAVTAAKQRHLSKAALAYLQEHGLLERPARFDVVAVQYLEDGPPRIELFRNAFDLCYGT